MVKKMMSDVSNEIQPSPPNPILRSIRLSARQGKTFNGKDSNKGYRSSPGLQHIETDHPEDGSEADRHICEFWRKAYRWK